MDDLPTIQWLAEQQPNYKPWVHEHILLGVDPGHTTGWCIFRDFELDACGQIDTREFPEAAYNIKTLFTQWAPHDIVLEDYRVYRWKQKHHVGSPMMTTRVIGAFETLASFESIRVYKQPAHIGKGFCTDPKLKAWGIFQTGGQKHANDAIRHAAHFRIFGPIKQKDKQRGTVG